MKPIAWYDPSNGVVSKNKDCLLFTALGQVWPLYPKKEWVGLTDDEVETLSYAAEGNTWQAVKLAEAKLKEKNT